VEGEEIDIGNGCIEKQGRIAKGGRYEFYCSQSGKKGEGFLVS